MEEEQSVPPISASTCVMMLRCVLARVAATPDLVGMLHDGLGLQFWGEQGLPCMQLAHHDPKVAKSINATQENNTNAYALQLVMS